MKIFFIILFSFSLSFIYSQDKFEDLYELEIKKDLIEVNIKNNNLFLKQALVKLKNQKKALNETENVSEIQLIDTTILRLEDSIQAVNLPFKAQVTDISKDIYRGILKLKESDRKKYKKIKEEKVEELKSARLENNAKEEIEIKEKEVTPKDAEIIANKEVELDSIEAKNKEAEAKQKILLEEKKAFEKNIADSINFYNKIREQARQDSIFKLEELIAAKNKKLQELSDIETLERMRLAKEKAKNNKLEEPKKIKSEPTIKVESDQKVIVQEDTLIVVKAENNLVDTNVQKEKKGNIDPDIIISEVESPTKNLGNKKKRLLKKKTKNEIKNQIDTDTIVSTDTPLKKEEIIEPDNNKIEKDVDFEETVETDTVITEIDTTKFQLPIIKEKIVTKEIIVDTTAIDLNDTSSPLNVQDLSDLEKMKKAKEKAKKDKQIKLVQEEKNNDIIFENKIDTSIISVKEKEVFIVESEEKIDTTIIGTVHIPKVIVKEKKKKRYSFGDVVDRNSSEKARFFLERAKLEINKGNINKAKDYIDKSLKLNPSNADAYILKGDIFASLNILEKAISQYHKASILDTNNAQLLYNLGNCFLQLGKDNYALEELTRAINVDDTYIMAYVGRASLLLKEEKYLEAIKDYNKIFTLNSYFYPAYRGRGLANLELGNYESAIEDFNIYLDFEPEEAFTITKRGLAKLYDNDIFGGCTDILNASEMGYEVAKKELKKHCEK